MTKPLSIFLGYDEREHAAYTVARNSIERHSSVPVLITPLYLPHLPMLDRPIEHRDGKMWCPISKAPMAPSFAISRFCVPFIQKEGWALFADSDILCRADIAELFALADNRYAVMVVKHHHDTGPDTKMDGQAQTYYARKNWSSIVLWQCGHPSHVKLVLGLNAWPGRDLHAFKWLTDKEIGTLPREWNHLVGVNKPNPDAKIVHFTCGTPDLPGYEHCEYAEDWK